MAVARGDMVTVALPGDYGKPRPALVVQDDAFGSLDSTTVLLVTSHTQVGSLVRIPIQPNVENGLRRASSIMIDKFATVPCVRLGPRIGRADDAIMRTVDIALARFLGLASHPSNR